MKGMHTATAFQQFTMLMVGKGGSEISKGLKLTWLSQ
jgi:hypothetical protein